MTEHAGIRQGGIYWARIAEADDDEIVHPQVVIQDDAINGSRIGSVVVCALSTNMRKAYAPGNVLLDEGEAGLPKRSVVVVSQVSCIEKGQLGEHIGSLGPERVEEILRGMLQVRNLGGS